MKGRKSDLASKFVSLRVIAVVCVLGLLLAAAGCGVKGKPRTPETPVIRGI